MAGFPNATFHNSGINETGMESYYIHNGTKDEEDLTIWDIPSIRITFIFIHSIVFFLCFLGNLTVILVVTLHWKMRSITNFCLGNLAVADLCVALFCVFQNLYSHMANTWILGKSICKIYHFINEMSLTASVLILVVISVERYLAIIHPMRCKSWLTLNRLRLTIGAVWGISGIYSLPRLYYTTTISPGYITDDGQKQIICTPNLRLYDSKLFDAIHMGLLFFFPLLIISILYTIIGIALWKSSRNQHMATAAASESSSSSANGVGDGADGLLSPGKRHRGTLCKEIFCCSFPCSCSSPQGPCRSCQFCPTGLLDLCPACFRRSSGPNGLELRNGKLGSGGNGSTEFGGGRSLSSSSYLSNRKPSSGTISTREPIVVVKFENLRQGSRRNRRRSSERSDRGDRRNSTKKHCKILMTVSSATENGEEIRNSRSDELNQESLRMESLRTESLRPNNLLPIVTPEIGEMKRDSNKSGSGTLLNPIENSLRNSGDSSPKSNPIFQTNEGPNSCGIRSGPPRLRRMRVLRGTNYGTKALEARRKIIKMLIIIVLTFAICNLPFHGRKIWQNWSPSYDGTSTFSVILTQVTTIIRYANSAINPLLYAFMSAKFRQSLGDLLGCRLRRPFRNTRNFSVRSTNVIPLSMAA